MTFANPAFLWAFAFLLPLIGIYILRVRPNRKTTTAFFLWQEILKQRKSQRLFHRLRDFLSLLLMFLAFTAVILAIAKPKFANQQNKDIVLLIDNSVSMNAGPVGNTSLDMAKQKARDIVIALDGNQRCSIATVSNSIQFLSNLTDNPRELLSAIDNIAATQMPDRPEALREFQSMQENRRQSVGPNTMSKDIGNDEDVEKEGSDEDRNSSTDQIESVDPTSATEQDRGYRNILISDGGILRGLDPDSSTTGTFKEPVDALEFLPVGNEEARNIGFVGCDLQWVQGTDRASLFFQLVSNSPQSVEVEIEVAFGTPDNLFKLIPVEVSKGVNRPEVFQVEGAKAGKWFIQITGVAEDNDLLSEDNQAFLVLPPVEPIGVAIASSDPFFYENSVEAFSSSADLLKIQPLSEARLTIVQGTPDPSLENELLIFQPDGESVWWESVGPSFDAVIPRVLNETHPVVRHAEAAAISFLGAKKIVAPAGAEILVVAEDDTPLIYRVTRAGQTAVVVNLDPVASEFYYSARFPVLIYSVATFLAGRDQELMATYAVGDSLPLPGLSIGNSLRLLTPDGKSMQVDQRQIKLQQSGFFEIGTGDQMQTVGASVLSAEESLLPEFVDSQPLPGLASGWSPSIWLTVTAMIVLAAESLLYQRRKVG